MRILENCLGLIGMIYAYIWRTEVWGCEGVRSLIYPYFGKWVGRILEGRGALWYKVFCAKYGEEEDGYVMV